MLILLASYLHASPAVQRTAVLKWNVVAALFGLLWEERMQQPALDMVRRAVPLLLVKAAGLRWLSCQCCLARMLIYP